MVKKHPLLAALLVTFILMTCAGVAAEERTYYLNQEWVKIWINQNGTIDLFYNISITLDSGPNINYVLIGQPQRDFTIGSAKDQYEHTLTATHASSGTDYKVKVNLYTPLRAGQTIWFTLITNVAHMIYEDTQNPGNVGMQFIPTWWEQAIVKDLRVSIVFPPEVTEDKVKTSVDWDNAATEDGLFSVYWERQSLLPGQKYTFGVSFPKEYVQYYDKQPSGLVAFFQKYGAALLTFGFFIAVIGAVVYVVRKKPYLIYSLLQKRAIWVEFTDPSLKLKIMQPFQDKTGTRETPLRYYESDFLKAIRKDGTLDEQKLARTVMLLRNTVEQKIRGYCRRDTIEYYRRIVAKAWDQVERAGTPKLASKAYDEQLLWLLLDPNHQSRTQTTFHDRAFEPSPFWLWYWYGYQHYHPNPTYKPNVETPTQSAKPPTIPGADFANNIATAVENTSNNIVANLEKFANAILPMPAAKSSTEPARHEASCVCACAACACVCACVSCACACASGGVG